MSFFSLCFSHPSDYECEYVKMLRTVATGFFENVLMVIRTIEAFDLETEAPMTATFAA